MNKALSPSLYYTLIVSLGGFIFGFDASVIAGANGFIDAEFNLSDWLRRKLSDTRCAYSHAICRRR